MFCKMLRRSSSNSSGFTLVELLVVIAIIGVLIAILLPAVQIAREAARRMQCSNNLKQFGIALHSFHDAKSVVPPGAIDTANTPTEAHSRFNIPVNVTHGWSPFLLPYVELQNVSDQYRWDRDWRALENQAVREKHLAIFKCPSAPDPNRVDAFTASNSLVQTTCSDYAALTSIDSSPLFAMGLIDGASKANSRTLLRVGRCENFSAITDGLSNTGFLYEDAGRFHRYLARKAVPGGRFRGGGWADRENAFQLDGYDNTGTIMNGACALNCTNDNEIYSFHAGGALLALADGSVRFMAQDLAIAVVTRLATRGADEPLGDW